MAARPMSGVIQHLRQTVLLRERAGLTDAQLLEDYLGRRDEAALAALVGRHGPMVWGVCRRVLRNHHDAEDAFQATFLVLIRKAASIASRPLLANWLYGVAHQTARKARATAARRKERERQVTVMPEPAAAAPDLWPDLRPLLDAELSRLPDKYRAVVVLCDLEGKTRKEAAQLLGVPEGTVGGWSARARALLAKRLARHGLTVSGGALAALLARNEASAGVPPAVLSATIQAVTAVAAGPAAAGAIAAPVAALTEGVLQAMLLTKLKTAVALGLVLATIALAGGLLSHSTAADEQTKSGRTHDVPAKLKGVEGGNDDVWLDLGVFAELKKDDVWLDYGVPLKKKVGGGDHALDYLIAAAELKLEDLQLAEANLEAARARVEKAQADVATAKQRVEQARKAQRAGVGAAIQTQAGDLVWAYRFNDALADEKFTGKRVHFSGQVACVRRIGHQPKVQDPHAMLDPNYDVFLANRPAQVPGYVVELAAVRDDGSPPVRLVFGEEARKQLAALERKARLTVEGLCAGIGPIEGMGDSIVIRDVKILSIDKSE